MRIMRETAPDDGFSLVEILVSMVLLSLLVLAFLPLMMQSLTVSSRMTTVASASQMLDEELELARAIADCPALEAHVAAPVAEVTDARGVRVQVTRTLAGTCPASGHAGVMTFRAQVDRMTLPSAQMARATTMVTVTSP